ncbi:hypothetical protein EXN66_Car019729 [Channa argus]|uniref:Uncharacterized protein n=1 Tax=Channa argus TaxID=215402 RepID=A0A6G1QMZ3_CHAAH|nr:hypothetical protein EXN66_Car019729 [Channa argus]
MSHEADTMCYYHSLNKLLFRKALPHVEYSKNADTLKVCVESFSGCPCKLSLLFSSKQGIYLHATQNGKNGHRPTVAAVKTKLV